MLDPLLRPLIDPPLNRLGRAIAGAGLGADAVTLIGFAFGLGAMAALAVQAYAAAFALIVVNRLIDGLDGAVARHVGVTDFGGYLDIVLDFLIYSGVVFAFAVGRPEQALPAAFLIFSFVGTGTAFLAFAILAAKRNVTTQERGRKSLYYIGGLTEGTETIAALLAICVFPAAFPWIAWIFGGLCWLTTLVRIVEARATFAERRGAARG